MGLGIGIDTLEPHVTLNLIFTFLCLKKLDLSPKENTPMLLRLWSIVELLLKSLSFTKTQFCKLKSLRRSGQMILDYGQLKPTKEMK